MKIGEILKKYWFVFLTGIALVVFVVVYTVSYVSNLEKTVNTKTIDGKDVIFSVGDEYGYADDLYDDMLEDYGVSLAYDRYYKAVVNKAYDTTEDMSTTAANAAYYYINYYGEDEILEEIKDYGYYTIDDFNQYFIDMMKEEQLLKDYMAANKDEITPYLESYKEDETPVYVQHILISVEDVQEVENEDGTTTLVANMTDEEKANLEAVESALTIDNFAEMAAQYSGDTSSASNSGIIGIVTAEDSDTYVEEFFNGVYATEVGTISAPILSEYGYHFIYVTAVSDDDLFDSDEFYSYLTSEDTDIMTKAIYIKGNELGVEINYEELKTELDALLEEAE